MQPSFCVSSTTNPEKYKQLQHTIEKHHQNYEKYLNNIYETIREKQFYLHRSKTPCLENKDNYSNKTNISNLSERPPSKEPRTQGSPPSNFKYQKPLKSLPKLPHKDVLQDQVVMMHNYSPKKTKLKVKASQAMKNSTPQNNIESYGSSIYHFRKFPQNKQALPYNLSNMRQSQQIKAFLMEEQQNVNKMTSGTERQKKTEIITLRDKRISIRDKRVKSSVRNVNSTKNVVGEQSNTVSSNNKVGNDHMNLLGLNVEKINYSEKKDYRKILNIGGKSGVNFDEQQYEEDLEFRNVKERCSNMRESQKSLAFMLRDENINNVVLQSSSGNRGPINFVDLDFCEELISQKMQFSKRNIQNINLTTANSNRQNLGIYSSSKKRVKNSSLKSSAKPINSNKNLMEKGELNPIYEGRYKRYLEMILKVSFTYKMYGRMDSEINPDMYCVIKNDKKYKAWIGNGNNGNLLKALIKRRFWWQIVEEKSWDVNFLWTQLKNNEYFKAQEASFIKNKQRKSIKKELQEESSFNKMEQSTSLSYNGEDNLSLVSNKEEKTNKNSLKKTRAQSSLPGSLSNANSIAQRKGSISPKKQREPDESKLIGKILPPEEKSEWKHMNLKLINAKTFNDKLKILEIEDFNPISCRCHNHLQNNFYLGNKKALFYNLKQYYELTGGNLFKTVPLTFHIKKGFKDPQYKRFITYYKKRQTHMKKLERQIERTGEGRVKMRNIWIVKPGELTNRGNGITVIDQIYELNSIIKSQNTHNDGSQKTFIVQLYIDRPLLYKKRKFDIRHFILVTHVHGVMKAYWFEEGYIRTSGYEFDIQDFEREIHLTNDAIQKYTSNYGRFEAGNKVSYQEFQKYLDTAYPKKNYSFFDQIIPKMKQISLDSVKSSFLKLSPQKLEHNFELFGLDFMIDSDFVPWLIEINTNPCLEITCPLQARLLPQLLDESLRLSLDVIYPPPCHYSNTYRHLVPEAGLNNMKYQLFFDERYDGDAVRKLYGNNKKRDNMLLEEIGELEDDEVFEDEGKQMKEEEIVLQ